MAYVKQNFTDGSVLTAAQLNRIEDGLVELFEMLESGSSGGGASARITSIALPSSNWTEEATNLYSQVVSIDGITERSKVDLLPSVEQLAIFYNKDVTFVTENDGGVVTVYAIGEKPTLDHTMQAQITEVAV